MPWVYCPGVLVFVIWLLSHGSTVCISFPVFGIYVRFSVGALLCVRPLNAGGMRCGVRNYVPDHITKSCLIRFLVASLCSDDKKTSGTGYLRRTVDEFTAEWVDHRSI
jgi:hypothetical protein